MVLLRFSNVPQGHSGCLGLTKVSEYLFSFVSCGDYHTMAIDQEGHLWACGNNDYGQLGLGDQLRRQKLEKVSNQKFVSISCGNRHTLAVDEKNCLWSCGYNNGGQLSQGDTQQLTQLTKVLFGEVDLLMNRFPQKKGYQTKNARNTF